MGKATQYDKALIPLNTMYRDSKARITNEMKSLLIGEHTFTIEEPCPLCSLELYEKFDDVECLCGGSEDETYQREITVPWNTAKKIYQDFAAVAIRSELKNINGE